MPAPAPSNPVERELEVQQAKVTAGEIARKRRDAIAFQLWQDGMTQKEVAERLDRADRAAGGEGITHGTCQKMLFRMRKAREQELIEAAR
jgi:transposase